MRYNVVTWKIVDVNGALVQVYMRLAAAKAAAKPGQTIVRIAAGETIS